MNNFIITTLGGHSALEICLGARQQGFETLVIAQKGRHRIYSERYRNLVSHLILVDSFREFTGEKMVAELSKFKPVFIPHRYVQVYCDLKELENKFSLPVFGNKFLLKYEEREGAFNQYQIMSQLQIPHPRQFPDPRDIDRLVLVKVREKERNYERAFFFAKNFREYREKGGRLVRQGNIDESDLENAVREEYLIGALVNFNFFHSPLTGKIELLGTDMRRQTNLDGILRIPGRIQEELGEELKPSYIETGHVAVTVKESLLEEAFNLAEKLTGGVRNLVPPGIIGPFALQTAVIPGPPKERIVVYDLSLRMPGSPGSIFTPYSHYHHGRPVSFGERIAMEIKEALKSNKIKRIVT